MAPGPRRWLANAAPLPPRLAAPGRLARPEDTARIDWPRTLSRKGPDRLQRSHLQRVRPPTELAALHLIALDNSGSMRSGARLALAKSFAASLVGDATRAGAHVALLFFGGQGVQWLQTAAPARRAAIQRIGGLGGGGGTPLAESLRQAQAELQAFRRRHGPAPRTLWLLTDGRSLERPVAPPGADQVVIVDFDDPLRPLGRCAEWAARWGAEWRRPLCTPF